MLWSLLMSANLDPELRVPSLTCILGTVPVLIAELMKIDLFNTLVTYIFGILKLGGTPLQSPSSKCQTALREANEADFGSRNAWIFEC